MNRIQNMKHIPIVILGDKFIKPLLLRIHNAKIFSLANSQFQALLNLHKTV